MPAIRTGPYAVVMRGFSRINLLLAGVGAAALFGVTVAIFVEVVWRQVGGRSQLWVTEVSEYSLLYVTFLAAPYLLEHNRHVVMDVVLEQLATGAARVLSVLVAALGLAICLTLCWQGLVLVLDQYAMGLRRISVLAPRSWYILAAWPLGMGLMAVQFFDQLLAAFLGRAGVQDDTPGKGHP
ncbi:MAG: TRAP transporter small permease [Rhodobacteraceae bacterium]|nr:TRAP transporter small permease [Paracoccaceae bacterium]